MLKGIYKRQLHEWAQTVTSEEFFDECCETTVEGIECIYCQSEEDVLFSNQWPDVIR